jgi:hypothetical protein
MILTIMRKERFDEAILAHSSWKKRLKKAIEAAGSDELRLKEAKDSHNCPFGQWLHSEASKKLPHRTELITLHDEFHREAERVLQLALQGKKGEAAGLTALGSPFSQLTAKLVNKLAEIRDDLAAGNPLAKN